MPAETFRDQWGIPHLRADSADELAFLQGFNAATDRSWQIEMERWRSEGRTAEQLGAPGIEWDTLRPPVPAGRHGPAVFRRPGP